jgi:prepilin peptidase CpaA
MSFDPKIPNWFTGALALALFPYAVSAGVPVGTIALHVMITAVAVLILVPLGAQGYIGYGAAKLLLVAVLWYGPFQAPWFLAYTLVATVGVGLLLAAAKVRTLSIPVPMALAAAALGLPFQA